MTFLGRSSSCQCVARKISFQLSAYWWSLQLETFSSLRDEENVPTGLGLRVKENARRCKEMAPPSSNWLTRLIHCLQVSIHGEMYGHGHIYCTYATFCHRGKKKHTWIKVNFTWHCKFILERWQSTHLVQPVLQYLVFSTNCIYVT